LLACIVFKTAVTGYINIGILAHTERCHAKLIWFQAQTQV